MVDRGIVTAAGAPRSLERSSQTLPVPLGGLAPVHRHSTALKRFWHRHRSAPMMALALAAAGSGVWLSTSPRSFAVGEDAVGVHVDDMILTRVTQSVAGTKVFTGAAALVIAVASPGVVRAGAVMTWNGAPTTGRCLLVGGRGGASETCQFDLGTTLLTSTDSFVARTRTWHRRYGDGAEIAIKLPAGSALIPIPFPLGR